MGSKKHILYSNRIFKTLELITSLIKNNRVIKFIYNISIYIFLLCIFLIVSRVFIWFKIENGNLNYLDILIILLAFILDLILFAKIISIRSKWKTLFFKRSDVLSLRKILRNQPFFLFFLTYMAFMNSLSVSMTPILYKSNLLIFFVVILFNTIIIFEFSFFIIIIFLLLFKIEDYSIILTSLKYNKNREIIKENIILKFKFIRICVKLLFVFFSFSFSFYYGMLLSEKINDILLGNFTILNFGSFILLFLTSISFGFFIKNFHELISGYFNLNKIKIDLKITSIFVFAYIIIVYLTKYLSIVFFYSINYDPTNELFLSFMESFVTEPEMLIKIEAFVIFLLFFITTVIFTIVIYTFFIIYNYIIYFSFLQKLEKIRKNEEIFKHETKSQKLIRKLFSKQLQNDKFIKLINYIYYSYYLIGSIIIGIYLLWFLSQDSFFGTNTYIRNFVIGNPFELPMYLILLFIFVFLILNSIFEVCQKKKKYTLTDFIDVRYLKIYFKFVMIYTNIAVASLVYISLKNIYYILEKDGNIIVTKNIQIIEYLVLISVSILIVTYMLDKLKGLLAKELKVNL